jgi:hypothetical protein
MHAGGYGTGAAYGTRCSKKGLTITKHASDALLLVRAPQRRKSKPDEGEPDSEAKCKRHTVRLRRTRLLYKAVDESTAIQPPRTKGANGSNSDTCPDGKTPAAGPVTRLPRVGAFGRTGSTFSACIEQQCANWRYWNWHR